MIYTLFLIIITINTIKCDVEITDSGILPVEEDDMAIIFYLTLKNNGEKNFEITVSMNECCDTYKPDENNCNMYLIGGNMGVLKKKETRNVTLINPNLYNKNRKGTCSISVIYRNSKYEKSLTKVIEFQTNASDESRNLCPTADTDPEDNCNQVDCTIKYFGYKNYFNPVTRECEPVPICLNDPQRDPNEVMGYSWIRNECINLNNTISKYDLDMLENNEADVSDNNLIITNNFVCHHGEMGANDDCICAGTWRTSLFEDDVYEPSLLVYHMCNIEPGGWNCVNKNRIEATALIVAILSFTIATKILILMCLLNWCYKNFRKNKEKVVCSNYPDDFDKSVILSDYNRDATKCVCKDLKKTRFADSRDGKVDVSYYPGGKQMTVDCTQTSCHDKCNYTIPLTNSTTTGTGQSYVTESELCTCSESTDYEIDFTGEEEENVEEESNGADDDNNTQSKENDEKYNEDDTNGANESNKGKEKSKVGRVKSGSSKKTDT